LLNVVADVGVEEAGGGGAGTEGGADGGGADVHGLDADESWPPDGSLVVGQGVENGADLVGWADHDDGLGELCDAVGAVPLVEEAELVGADEESQGGGLGELVAEKFEGVDGVRGGVGVFFGAVDFVGADAGPGVVGQGEAEHGQAVWGRGLLEVLLEGGDGGGHVQDGVGVDGAADAVGLGDVCVVGRVEGAAVDEDEVAVGGVEGHGERVVVEMRGVGMARCLNSSSRYTDGLSVRVFRVARPRLKPSGHPLSEAFGQPLGAAWAGVLDRSRSELEGAEESVAGVAEAGEDVAGVGELSVDGADPDFDVVVGFEDVSDAFGCGDEGDEAEVGGAGLSEDADGGGGGAAGGEHGVEEEDGAALDGGGEVFVVGDGGEVVFVSVEAEVAHGGVGDEPEDGVGDAHAGAEDGDEGDGLVEGGAGVGFEWGVDGMGSGGEVAGGFVGEHGADLADELAEDGGRRGAIAGAGEVVVDEGVVGGVDAWVIVHAVKWWGGSGGRVGIKNAEPDLSPSINPPNKSMIAFWDGRPGVGAGHAGGAGPVEIRFALAGVSFLAFGRCLLVAFHYRIGALDRQVGIGECEAGCGWGCPRLVSVDFGGRVLGEGSEAGEVVHGFEVDGVPLAALGVVALGGFEDLGDVLEGTSFEDGGEGVLGDVAEAEVVVSVFSRAAGVLGVVDVGDADAVGAGGVFDVFEGLSCAGLGVEVVAGGDEVAGVDADGEAMGGLDVVDDEGEVFVSVAECGALAGGGF